MLKPSKKLVFVTRLSFSLASPWTLSLADALKHAAIGSGLMLFRMGVNISAPNVRCLGWVPTSLQGWVCPMYFPHHLIIYSGQYKLSIESFLLCAQSSPLMLWSVHDQPLLAFLPSSVTDAECNWKLVRGNIYQVSYSVKSVSSVFSLYRVFMALSTLTHFDSETC
jgi:hypothetical protein